MGKKNKGGANLGRVLIKDRFGRDFRHKVDNDTMLHTTEIQDGYDWGRLNLNSVTEESSFQEFLRTAELAGTEFQAEKLNITFVNPKEGVGLLTTEQEKQLGKKYHEKRELIKIPRRPKWSASTTAEELRLAENESFLDWRRSLALLQEDEEIVLTPYEKNLEFWRQLWRVVERSDVVVQIVDARNPLMFRSNDLEKYVKEVDPNKMNLILVNKSDYLTQEQRELWAHYFDREGLQGVFYSATLAAAETEQAAAKAKENVNETELSAVKAPETTENKGEENITLEELKKAARDLCQSLDTLESKLEVIERKIGSVAANAPRNSPNILNRLELISFFKGMYKERTYTPTITTIGLVGYPNVGKSSTINSLLTQKKVSVSATPGKTKHFQTLFLDRDLLLCDCPGLVMPSFVLTKADMILNGILPIDQMRDYVPPVNLLCNRIPRHILEENYGIVIAKPQEREDPDRSPFAEELLLAFAYNRGFMTAKGQPDQARAARYVCKDYVNGKLLYCTAPPKVPQLEYHKFPPRSRRVIDEKELPNRQQRAMRIFYRPSAAEVERNFLETIDHKAYVKGHTNLPHIRVASEGAAAGTNKPWRAEKKEKREKLRKKFAHLDEH